MSKGQMRSRVGRAVAITALAVPAILVGAGGAAWADGSSALTNGCYVTWGNTAWAAKCSPASVSGEYQAHVKLAWQTDYNGSYRYVSKGSWTTFDNGSAWNGVQAKGNYVSFRG